MKAKVKIITGLVVNEHSWINDTWLSPYYGYPVTLYKFSGGRLDVLVDGCRHDNVQGNYTAPNGWQYKIKKLLSKTP